MTRLRAVNTETAEGQAKELLDAVQQKLGMVPNLIRTFANSPAVLQAYLSFSGALENGVLPPRLREQIALAVGQSNQCEYCLSAHTAIGKMVGLSDEEIIDSRNGNSSDPKTKAALRFARNVVDKRGLISDQDFEPLTKSNFTEAEISEIIAAVSLNIFTNYFNHIAETIVDFPAAPAIECTSDEAACSSSSHVSDEACGCNVK